eukprot:scaffold682_cov363-Pavlova_lutheri.AAC.36
MGAANQRTATSWGPHASAVAPVALRASNTAVGDPCLAYATSICAAARVANARIAKRADECTRHHMATSNCLLLPSLPCRSSFVLTPASELGNTPFTTEQQKGFPLDLTTSLGCSRESWGWETWAWRLLSHPAHGGRIGRGQVRSGRPRRPSNADIAVVQGMRLVLQGPAGGRVFATVMHGGDGLAMKHVWNRRKEEAVWGLMGCGSTKGKLVNHDPNAMLNLWRCMALSVPPTQLCRVVVQGRL